MFDKYDVMGYSGSIDTTKVYPVVQENSHCNVIIDGSLPRYYIKLPEIEDYYEWKSNMEDLLLTR